MNSIEYLSKIIAWIIVTLIKIVIYPIYFVTYGISSTCNWILNKVSDNRQTFS